MVQFLDLDWCRFGSVIIFDYRALFLCAKSRTCLRITIPAYCLNICGSIFGVLLCLLYSKLILGSKTISQNMRHFNMYSLKCVGVFPHMDTDKIFFLETFKLVWSGVNLFQIIPFPFLKFRTAYINASQFA